MEDSSNRRRWLAFGGIGIVAALSGLYFFAQWRLNVWYDRDFETAFRKQIEGEIGPGETLTWSANAEVTRRDSRLAQGYLLCGTATLHGRDGALRTERYAVGFSPTPFGFGAHDLYTPATRNSGMAWVCGG